METIVSTQSQSALAICPTAATDIQFEYIYTLNSLVFSLLRTGKRTELAVVSVNSNNVVSQMSNHVFMRVLKDCQATLPN